MHFGHEPRKPITNLIGQPTCLLSNWKRTITKYVSGQPAELQVFTFHDSDGELTDYLVFNEAKKRGRSVSKNLKKKHFLKKKPSQIQ